MHDTCKQCTNWEEDKRIQGYGTCSVLRHKSNPSRDTIYKGTNYAWANHRQCFIKNNKGE